MILPCRESPMTGTVACSNDGPSWVGGPSATSNAEEGQRHRLKWYPPDEDLAGALLSVTSGMTDQNRGTINL